MLLDDLRTLVESHLVGRECRATPRRMAAAALALGQLLLPFKLALLILIHATAPFYEQHGVGVGCHVGWLWQRLSSGIVSAIGVRLVLALRRCAVEVLARGLRLLSTPDEF